MNDTTKQESQRFELRPIFKFDKRLFGVFDNQEPLDCLPMIAVVDLLNEIDTNYTAALNTVYRQALELERLQVMETRLKAQIAEYEKSLKELSKRSTFTCVSSGYQVASELKLIKEILDRILTGE